MLNRDGVRPGERVSEFRCHLGRLTPARVEIFESGAAVLPPSLRVVHPGPQSDANGDTSVTVLRTPAADEHWFCYADGCRFRISGAGDAVAAYRPPAMSDDDLQVYLLGPILGFVLRLQGVVSLHASAVVLGAGAVAFAGTGGAGKSTLAARFALSGTPVVSDDVLPVEEGENGFVVRPVVPQIKLWPESVTQLCGRPDALPKLVPASPDWDKCGLDLTRPGMVFAGGRPPLRAVYLLEPRSTTIAEPVIVPVPPAEGLVALIANSYVNYALSKEMRVHEFGVLSRLVQSVPIRRLTLPAMISDVAILAGCLEEDLTR